jgi:hypothetical protein
MLLCRPISRHSEGYLVSRRARAREAGSGLSLCPTHTRAEVVPACACDVQRRRRLCTEHVMLCDLVRLVPLVLSKRIAELLQTD